MKVLYLYFIFSPPRPPPSQWCTCVTDILSVLITDPTLVVCNTPHPSALHNLEGSKSATWKISASGSLTPFSTNGRTAIKISVFSLWKWCYRILTNCQKKSDNFLRVIIMCPSVLSWLWRTNYPLSVCLALQIQKNQGSLMVSCFFYFGNKDERNERAGLSDSWLAALLEQINDILTVDCISVMKYKIMLKLLVLH